MHMLVNIFMPFFTFQLFFFLRGSLALSPRLECSGMISAHCSLWLLGSSNYSALASQGAWITGVCQHVQLILIFLVEMGFHRVGEAGLKLQASSNLPASVSQSAGITGMSHYAWSMFRHLHGIPLDWPLLGHFSTPGFTTTTTGYYSGYLFLSVWHPSSYFRMLIYYNNGIW